ncbi:MAG: BolA family transcriptional regulator [Gammaproteobacteria bacterium]|nr:BolA family transcriptional regulator [Gammaproteobacteria bacterium]
MKRKQIIESTINQALNPMHLSVEDESHTHSVPDGAQSHFKLIVVSDQFEGKMPVARHRMINSLLKAEFDQGLHALALHTMTPQEWFNKGGQAPDSPPCGGGPKG